MPHLPQRPKDEEELQKREVIGTIRASRFVRALARAKTSINVETVYAIHKEIFKDAWPEIAGILRIEDLKITGSHHRPPHYSEVPALMMGVNTELVKKLQMLRSVSGFAMDGKANQQELEMIQNILAVTAWAHHKITHIHPFRDGNGRTARLLGNLILERYGLVGVSIKIERENRNRYRASLSQIDTMNDHEPLMNIIAEGIVDRYNGVPMRIV